MGEGQPESETGAPNLDRLADAATLLVALSAMVVAGLAVWDRVNGPDGAGARTMEERVVEDWDAVIAAGQRMGPRGAEVTIVMFGDYECSFCRRAERHLRALREAYPDQVAVVYRHLPLESNPNAYHAAQLAECAALQSMFKPVHRLLYSAISLDGLEPNRLADDVGIPDREAYRRCVDLDEVVPRIEADIAAAGELSIARVPTIIFQGTLLPTPPDSAALFERTQESLKTGS